MRVTRMAAVAGLIVIPTVAVALPTFVKDFAATYSIPKGSKLAAANCAACHIGTSPKLNPYGQDLKNAMDKAKTRKLTKEILVKVENLDSDKDGVKNIAEIRRGTLPGDPGSK